MLLESSLVLHSPIEASLGKFRSVSVSDDLISHNVFID